MNVFVEDIRGSKRLHEVLQLRVYIENEPQPMEFKNFNSLIKLLDTLQSKHTDDRVTVYFK